MRAEIKTHIVTLLVDYNKGYAFYAIKIFNDEIFNKNSNGVGGDLIILKKETIISHIFQILSKLLFCFSGE